jgi:alkylation response protein AidB-like acyl-CoA dehydrogenase
VSEASLRHRLDELRAAGALDAPHPGAGRTAERLERLASFGEEDLSVARLAEPHLDARAIAEDLGVSLSVDGLYGVWASGGHASTMTLHRDGSSWCLTGDKPFCSGADICDGALVTVGCDDPVGDLMVELDLVAARRSGRLLVERSDWATVAFEDTCTATIVADGLAVPASAVLGTARDYLDRAGFWHGALGPAAVWVGGIRSLVAAAAAAAHDDAHDRAAFGRMRALEWATGAWLRVAADEVDEHPGDLAGALRRAVTVRHLVQRSAIEVIDLFAQVGGPRSLAFDPVVVRRVQELQLYVRQFHGPVELELLGSPGPDARTP